MRHVLIIASILLTGLMNCHDITLGMMSKIFPHATPSAVTELTIDLNMLTTPEDRKARMTNWVKADWGKVKTKTLQIFDNKTMAVASASLFFDQREALRKYWIVLFARLKAKFGASLAEKMSNMYGVVDKRQDNGIFTNVIQDWYTICFYKVPKTKQEELYNEILSAMKDLIKQSNTTATLLTTWALLSPSDIAYADNVRTKGLW